jgi:hypothetical protein
MRAKNTCTQACYTPRAACRGRQSSQWWQSRSPRVSPLLQWQAAHQQLEDCIVVCMPMALREACVNHTMALDQHLHWQQLHQQHSLMNLLRLQVANQCFLEVQVVEPCFGSCFRKVCQRHCREAQSKQSESGEIHLSPSFWYKASSSFVLVLASSSLTSWNTETSRAVFTPVPSDSSREMMLFIGT